MISSVECRWKSVTPSEDAARKIFGARIPLTNAHYGEWQQTRTNTGFRYGGRLRGNPALFVQGGNRCLDREWNFVMHTLWPRIETGS